MSENARAISVEPGTDGFEVYLADGRRLRVPYAWFPRLNTATTTQRNHWELIADGIGIHWPDVDEDLSVDGLLRGEAVARICERYRSLPLLDDRTADEIIGYDEDGLPG